MIIFNAGIVFLIVCPESTDGSAYKSLYKFWGKVQIVDDLNNKFIG